MKELNEIEMAEVTGGTDPFNIDSIQREWLRLWGDLVGNSVDHHVDMYGNPVEI